MVRLPKFIRLSMLCKAMQWSRQTGIARMRRVGAVVQDAERGWTYVNTEVLYVKCPRLCEVIEEAIAANDKNDKDDKR